MNKPPENLFSKGLADIDYNVLVGSIVLVVIYQEGGVTPEREQNVQLPHIRPCFDGTKIFKSLSHRMFRN